MGLDPLLNINGLTTRFETMISVIDPIAWTLTFTQGLLNAIVFVRSEPLWREIEELMGESCRARALRTPPRESVGAVHHRAISTASVQTPALRQPILDSQHEQLGCV